ncbi:hypothetical protein E2C01_074036 [Portunus trituberculatus]|uniref:Uncharacterized protein n=1 Tax=Portunus trituberculatus TaxID=210409 RepID=A0A5B7ID94_PORTR|nr:hypothetical protein [Portunus trituberculatus]
MCSYPECRFQMIMEILMSNPYQLLEEVRDGHLGERMSGVPDREEKVPRPRWGLCPVKVPLQSTNRTEEPFVVIGADSL